MGAIPMHDETDVPRGTPQPQAEAAAPPLDGVVLPPAAVPQAPLDPKAAWAAKMREARLRARAARAAYRAELKTAGKDVAEPAKRAPPNKDTLTKPMRRAVQLLTKGLTVPQAAQVAGVSEDGLRLALKRPHVAEALKADLQANLLVAAAKAVNRVDHLIDNARSEYVQLEAARTALDRAGLVEGSGETLTNEIVVNIKL